MFFLVICIFSFLTFGMSISDIFLEDYDQRTGFANGIRIVMALQILICVPLKFGPMRDSISAIMRYV